MPGIVEGGVVSPAFPTTRHVSVALCTHNGARFIVEQVRSICTQSLRPAEIVLSDDASSDDTVALAERTVQECNSAADRMPVALRCVVNPAPLGVTRNFDQAIGLCTGALVALADQDDIWHPNKLERMVACFDADASLSLLHTDARLVDGDGRPIGCTLFYALRVTRAELTGINEGRAFDVFLHRNLVTGATAMVRKSVHAMTTPFPAGWLHDEWLGMMVAAVAKVGALTMPLVDYRQHGANQVGARRESWQELLAKALSSRGDTHVKRACKTVELLDRLSALGNAVSSERLEKVRGKLVHQQFRANLPKARWQRIVPVLREARTGRYTLYGRGWRGIARDLLEEV